MKLILEDKTIFEGLNFGYQQEVIGRVVFNPSMVGYEEILSNPIYKDLIVVMNYPLIGNYGVAGEDYDYKNISLKALVVNSYNDYPSNFRSTSTLADVMEENKVVGLSDIDTRMLIKKLRNKSLKGIITSDDTLLEDALEKLKNYEENKNLIQEVSTKKCWYSKTSNPKYQVVVLDSGVKTTFVKALNKQSYNLSVIPYNYDLKKIEDLKPDGIIISNGPGKENIEVIEIIKYFKDKLPILGLGYGALMINKALGGINKEKESPVFNSNSELRNLSSKKIMSVVSERMEEIESLSKKLISTHEFVNNHEVAGFKSENELLIGLMYEPLSVDLNDLNEDIFKKFSEKMEDLKCQKEQI